MLEGKLPRRAVTMVRDWADQHRAELRDNWEKTQLHEPLVPIEPLE